MVIEICDLRFSFMLNRFKMIASAYLLLIRQRKIFLLRRKNTGYKDGYYSVPAGHIEENESLTSGATREFFEEVGLRFNSKDLKLVHVMHRKEEDIRMDFFFTGNVDRQKPFNKEPEKCDDLGWFPLNSLPNNTIPYIAEAIRSYQKHVFFSEFGW